MLTLQSMPQGETLMAASLPGDLSSDPDLPEPARARYRPCVANDPTTAQKRCCYASTEWRKHCQSPHTPKAWWAETNTIVAREDIEGTR